MIVLAETNFVFELSFSRDKFASCLDLLTLAERKEIELLLPAYSLVEPYETMIRRQKARVRAHDMIRTEIAEIGRSEQFKEPASQLGQLTGLLIQAGEVEQQELAKVITKLLEVTTLIDLNAAILQQAAAYRDELGLSPQDSVVFASVMAALALRGGPACFITKNSKDFATPDIAEALERYDCKLLSDFADGHSYVVHRLSSDHPPASAP
ncbi:hypothetical protein NX773_00715 [Massilia solisilvae]|uniref:DUF4935 domain-containing protein n=1 Tax=Massilia solisilvae TaxID=1811225 RepID=A0ABT2BDU1_9BURK|nr:hypothetical protein [Massilia solisilvae]MCS0606685.1 hypothetical protein [Massilia solisilvae]